MLCTDKYKEEIYKTLFQLIFQASEVFLRKGYKNYVIAKCQDFQLPQFLSE